MKKDILTASSLRNSYEMLTSAVIWFRMYFSFSNRTDLLYFEVINGMLNPASEEPNNRKKFARKINFNANIVILVFD